MNFISKIFGRTSYIVLEDHALKKLARTIFNISIHEIVIILSIFQKLNLCQSFERIVTDNF